MLLFSDAVGQNAGRVTGAVTDNSGQALIGVSVKVKGQNTGAATDVEGKYSITLPQLNATLVYTYIGFSEQEIAVDGRETINVQLTEDRRSLNEVVVIGYGTVKKSDITGSVVSLKAAELTPGANGAQFVNNPNPRNPLNSLNPSDIASIEILKDASATAIYDSRGANGVVLITTNKGAVGKLKVGYNAYYGTQKVANSVAMLNAQQYHDVLNSIIDAGGGGTNPLRVNDNIPSIQIGRLLCTKLLLHKVMIFLSLAGVTNTKYYASFEYFDQQGVIKNSGVKRYTGRSNLDNSVSQKYGFGVTLNTSYIKDLYNSTGRGTNDNGSALYTAMNYDPTGPIYNPDDSYNDPPSLALDNPLAMIYGQTANSNSCIMGCWANHFLLSENSKCMSEQYWNFIEFFYYKISNETLAPKDFVTPNIYMFYIINNMCIFVYYIKY